MEGINVPIRIRLLDLSAVTFDSPIMLHKCIKGVKLGVTSHNRHPDFIKDWVLDSVVKVCVSENLWVGLLAEEHCKGG